MVKMESRVWTGAHAGRNGGSGRGRRACARAQARAGLAGWALARGAGGLLANAGGRGGGGGLCPGVRSVRRADSGWAERAPPAGGRAQRTSPKAAKPMS